MSAHCFTQAEIDEITASEGIRTAKEVAERLGLSTKQVQSKAATLGVNLRSARVAKWDVDMAHALRAEGLSIPVIAEKLELNRRQIDYILQRKKPGVSHAAA